MAIYALAPGVQQQIVYAASSQRIPPITEYTITNLDTEQSVYIGAADSDAQEPDLTTDLTRDVLAPLQSVTVRATLDWFGLNLNDNDPVQVDVIPEGINQSVSPVGAAAAFITAGVPLAIAEQLQGQGFSFVSPPIALYTLTQQSSGSGSPGAFGCTTAGTYASQAAADQQILTFNANVGRNATVRELFTQWKSGMPPITNPGQDGQQAIDEGIGVYINFQPTPNVPSAQATTDANNILTSLSNLHALGMKIAGVKLWHEPQVGSNNLSGPQFVALMQFYYPLIHGMGPAPGWRLGVCHEGFAVSNSTILNAYDPGAAFQDFIMVDVYGVEYINSGKRVDDVFTLAAGYNLPAGIGEFNTANRKGTLSQTDGTTFLNYILGLANNQLAGGHSLEALMWYENNTGTENPNETIASSSDYRVTLLQQINDAVTTGTTAGGGPGPINPGTTTTLTPNTPATSNPNFAVATGFSYDAILLLKAGAGSTNPFVRVNLNWHNQDITTAQPVRKQSFIFPMGVSTSTFGTLIRGTGPQHGQTMSVTIQNLDTVACTYQAIINATSRNVTRHDWRWEAAGSVGIPGFTRANAADDAVLYNTIGSATVNAGTSSSWLFSVYTGQAYLLLKVTGAAGTNTVHFTLTPQPASEFSTAEMFSTFLPGSGATGNETFFTIALPRGPLLLTVNNTDANNVGVVATIIPIET